MRAFLFLMLSLGLACLSAVAGEDVSIQPYNLPDYYICHREGAGELALFQSDLDPADFCFVKTKGLDGSDSVSFESKKYPRKYLRHKNYRIVLEADDGSELFKKDASFRVVPGLADSSALSFESVNKPGFYFRHKNYKLLLESGGDDLFLLDSTFTLSPPVK